jgi:hypothetical protein
MFQHERLELAFLLALFETAVADFDAACGDGID